MPEKRPSSKYNGVYAKTKTSAKSRGWQMDVTINGQRYKSSHLSEEDAAKAADRIYIKYRQYDKLNIIKPKMPGQAPAE